MEQLTKAKDIAKEWWDIVLNKVVEVFAQAQVFVGDTLTSFGVNLDDDKKILVVNSIIVVTLTTALFIMLLLFSCIACGKKKPAAKKDGKKPREVSETTSSSPAASSSNQKKKGGKKSGKGAASQEKPEAPAAAPTAVFETVPPATGPAPTSRVGPLFTDGISFFAVAREVPITNTDNSRALMAVASKSPRLIRVFTRMSSETVVDPVNPPFFDLCCEDLRVVSAKRISPKTVCDVAVAPSGKFVAVAVDQPPALCVFDMADVLRQHADYCQQYGLTSSKPNKRPPRETFEAYPKATITDPHGRVVTIANIVCLEDAKSGNSCVISSAEDTSVAVWNAHDGKLVSRAKTNQITNLALAASPDSSFVAFGTKMEDVNIWNWTPTSPSSSGAVLSKCMLVRGHRKAVNHVAFGGSEFPWLFATASVAERSLCLRRVSDVWRAGVEPEVLWNAPLPRYGNVRDPVDGGNTCTLTSIAISNCGKYIALTYADRTEVLSASDASKLLCVPTAGGVGNRCAWIASKDRSKGPILALQSSNVVALYNVPALIQN